MDCESLKSESFDILSNLACRHLTDIAHRIIESLDTRTVRSCLYVNSIWREIVDTLPKVTLDQVDWSLVESMVSDPIRFSDDQLLGVTPYTGFYPRLYVDDRYGSFICYASLSTLLQTFSEQNIILRIIGQNGFNHTLSVTEDASEVLTLQIIGQMLFVFHQQKHNTPIRQACSIFLTIFDLEANEKISSERVRHDESGMHRGGYLFDRKCQYWKGKFYILHGDMFAQQEVGYYVINESLSVDYHTVYVLQQSSPYVTSISPLCVYEAWIRLIYKR